MIKNKIKFGLIGFGRFGKKYFKNLKKSVNLDLKYIVKKQNLTIKGYKIFTDLNKAIKINTDGVIIATPPETHFNLCKFFLEKKKSIILEKPAVSNLNELKKLMKIKKTNLPLLVNHSDLYNPIFKELLKFKNKIGKINFIEINYGKFDYQYTLKRGLLPIVDWLPHILATLTTFLKKDLKFKITYENLIKKNNCFFQELNLDIFDLKGTLRGKIFFSNLKKNRLLEVTGSKGSLKYDAYNFINNSINIRNKITRLKKGNYISPMENLLQIFLKSIKYNSKINDLNVVLRYQKYLDLILKKI